jgi:transketolase
MSHRSKSAHFGSSLSAVEILDTVLSVSNIRPATADRADRDRLVVSKGHAAMVTYAVLEAWGLIASSAIEQYLDDGSVLWGHVTQTSHFPAIDASTGSLGHGLSIATGLALGARLRAWNNRVYCLLSDGECDEGSTWEAILFAGHNRLDRLCAIVDYNKIQSIGAVKDVLELEPFAAKWESFGWRAVEVDGHDCVALQAALALLPAKNVDLRPLVLIAHTIKGKGVPRIEGTVASHYIPALAGDHESF